MSVFLLLMSLANGSSEAVDPIRLSLETSSTFWFGITKYAGYAVMLGCAMEIPETCIVVRDWLSLRFKNLERNEDKKSIFIPLSAVGLLVIVLGIAVETYAEGKASSIDATLREHESDKITAAEGEAASATKEAGNAKGSAEAAKANADSAKLASEGAVAAAGKAKSEADSFEARIVAANQNAAGAILKAADAESHLANALERAARAEGEMNKMRTPRSLRDTVSLIGALNRFSGTKYELNVFQDDESIQFTKEFNSVLARAGWIRLPSDFRLGVTRINMFGSDFVSQVPICLATGIEITVQAKQSIDEVRLLPPQALPKSHIAAAALDAVISTHKTSTTQSEAYR